MDKLKIIGYAILSGLILWLSFNYHWLWIFSFVAILPLLYLIYEKKLSVWQHLGLGFLAGWIMAAGVMIWHWHILPVTWAGIDNQLHGILLILYVWGLSSVMGGIIGLWQISFYLLKRNNFLDVLLAPALWVLFEYIRSIAISILWYGDGGLIGPHWSIAFIGYTLAASKLFLPLASLGGTYLLGGVVIAINILIYFSLSAWRHQASLKSHIKLAGLILFVCLAVAWLFYFMPSNNSQLAKVAVVTTYMPSYSHLTEQQFIETLGHKVDILREIKNSNQNPEIIAFPEDARVLVGLQLLGQQQVIQDIFGAQTELLIVDSARVAKKLNSAPALEYFYLNTKTGELSQSDKIFLVPHGEYLPYLTDRLLKLSGLRAWAEGFRAARVSQRGDNVKPAEFKNFKIGTVACSEVMSSSINSHMISAGANMVINGASHAVFNGSKVLYDQMINMAKVRAVESNRYYILAGNFVPSFVVDNQGQLTSQTEWGRESVIYQDVAVIQSDSVYTQFGRYTLPVIILLIIAWAAIKRYWPQYLTRLKK